MSKLYLIRHGQASLGSSNYDQLSAQGEQQARWLGEYFEALECFPSLIVTGSLQRHRQTAENIVEGLNVKSATDFETIEEWNEFDFEKVIFSYLQQYPEQTPQKGNTKAFFSLLKNALHAWSSNKIESPLPESWTNFESRVKTALNSTLSLLSDKPSDNKQNIFVVSSGGAISMALRHILDLSATALIDLNLQSRNTGVTECYATQQVCYLTSFNAVPHLETPGRQKHITFA